MRMNDSVLDFDDALPAPMAEAIQRHQEKLRRELGPQISAWLDAEDVIEIMLNPDGALWVERIGQPPALEGRMPRWRAESLMSTVAAMTNTTINAEMPYLECELPFDGSRFEAVLPPLSPGGPAFCIRRRPRRIWQLDDYAATEIGTLAQIARLREAVAKRRNILVAGGTGSGKTALANALIAHIDEAAAEDRLVIIEDTIEIQCSARNFVFLQTTLHTGMQQVLAITMRLRPDRIIVGEVRGGEALTLVNAWNTGHPGGIATIHANDALSALVRLQSLIGQATSQPMQAEIGAAIDLIVFIAKDTSAPAGRRVRQLIEVHGFSDGEYQTTVLEG